MANRQLLRDIQKQQKEKRLSDMSSDKKLPEIVRYATKSDLDAVKDSLSNTEAYLNDIIESKLKSSGKIDVRFPSQRSVSIPVTVDQGGTGATTATQARTNLGAGTGSGSVTDVSVVTANGVSGSVATSTTTPAITLALGAITPTTVNSVTISGASTPTLAVTGTSSISGANTGDNVEVAAQAVGFTITKGTTPKTLTVALDANVSGTNTGDNATNTQYSSLVTNATHTGDATGSGALTVVALNGTNLAALGTGVLKNTTTTGVPFISKVALTEPATAATLTIADSQTLTVNGSATITNGTHSGTNTGDNTVATALTGTPSITVATVTTTGNIELGHASDTTISRSAAGAIQVEGVQVLLSGAALGTPSSGTLTNATGLPISGLTASTSTAIGVGSVELGHASDTTIARVSAGVASIEGVNILTVAGGTLTGNVTLGENTSIALDPAGSADGKYSGITVTGTGGATIAFGDLVTLDKDDSRWELVDISVAAAATGDARGIIGIAVTSSSDGGALTVLLHGIIRADANFPALTIGAAVYASTTGDIVVAQPTTVDYVIRIVGFAMTADEIYFNPSNDYITHIT